MNKRFAFNFMLSLFVEWRMATMNEDEGTALRYFSKLHVLKLLFLAASVRERDVNPNSENQEDLLDIFSFVALPYGPVETDIYDMMLGGQINNYFVGDRFSERLEEQIDFSTVLDEQQRQQIRNSVDLLRRINDNLITMSAFELVDVTHRWESWDKAFRFAKFLGQNSHPMAQADIQHDSSRYFGIS